MALPTADSLLPAVASVQRSLSVFEAGLSGTQIAVGSSDGKVVAIANGLVELVSITIDPGELTQGATLFRTPTDEAPANVGVALSVEGPRFEEFLIERLSSE